MTSSSFFGIQMLGINKSFGPLKALDDVSVSISGGEVTALLGENGAGKSTLMSILFGSYKKDSGVIKIDGKEVNISCPLDAVKLGIGMVFQHFKLVHSYTVAQNIILGAESVNRWGLLDMQKAKNDIACLIERYALKVPMDALIEDLSVGMQQRVEILKVLYRKARIVILDEPSAALNDEEAQSLMDIILSLKAQGTTVIIITHKLKEVRAVASRCVVLRGGKLVGAVNVKDATDQSLSRLMVGEDIEGTLKVKKAHFGKKVLAIKGDIGAIAAREGEILGIAGVSGNGQGELCRGIVGLNQDFNVTLCGKDVTRLCVRKRIERGLGYVSEDRLRDAIMSEESLAFNAILKSYFLPPVSLHGVVDFSVAKKMAKKMIARYNIKALEDAKIGSLSGGNQQKFVMARELLIPNLKVLVIACPTRGLDIKATDFIRRELLKLRDSGLCIVLVSYDLDEILSLSDTVAVMVNKKIAGVFNKRTRDLRAKIGALMASA